MENALVEISELLLVHVNVEGIFLGIGACKTILGKAIDEVYSAICKYVLYL